MDTLAGYRIPVLKNIFPFGRYEIEIITRYVFSYSQLYKSETYPYPTLKGLGQSWIINKIKNLVDIDNSKKEITELSNEVF